MYTEDDLDWSKCVLPPFLHQKVGVLKFLNEPFVGLLDEMGACKTKQVIDAACFMWERQMIDCVVIICPAQVKDVWIHPQYSQIMQHAFVRGVINEFTSRSGGITRDPGRLSWVVTSVELLRNMAHVHRLLSFLSGRKWWAVVDESSAIGNFRASQTRGVMALRTKASRRAILNGTPTNGRLLDLYPQFQFLDPAILGFKSYFAFRNRHAKMGGFMGKSIVGFEHIEEIQAKIAPYVLRRMKSECIDILPKIYAPPIEVRLSAETWKKYEMMRDEFVGYVEGFNSASVVSAAPIKALRLAQICSGFLGGFHEDEDTESRTAEIGSELTDHFLDRFAFRLDQDSLFKLIVWCRFRPEIARLEARIRERFPDTLVQVLQGGLSKSARQEAVGLFHPDAPDIGGSAVLIGQPQAGRFGSNFTKCSNVDYLSNDYSMLTRSQSEDRIHRPGQRFQAFFQDYVVVGPQRQRTVSGIILKALNQKAELARWTCEKWQSEIMKENEDDIPF